MSYQPALTTEQRETVLRMLPVAREAAEAALGHLVDCLDDTQVSERVYARRHRIKQERDVERKVTSKRNDKKRPKPNYQWTDITDIVGLRFITLYRDDIFPVSEVILRALLDLRKDMGKGPFKRPELKEVKLYMANSVLSDPLNVRLKELTDSLHREGDHWKYDKPEIGERYSSVHFVTWVNQRVPGGGSIRIPIEIQVRSVFEDAWGEVDHALLYEETREGAPLEGISLQIERHSNALKKMMDAAADFADALRTLKNSQDPPPTVVRATIDAASYVQEVCNALGVPEGVVATLMALVAERDALDSAIGGRLEMLLRADYTRLADGFSKIRTEQEAPGGFLHHSAPTEDRHQFSYVTRMEEAVSRLASLDEGQLALAIEQLLIVTRDFPSHPVGWLRLGEAYSRQLEVGDWGPDSERAFRLGEEAFRRAAVEAQHLQGLQERDRFFAASSVHEDYINHNLARLHAFMVWRAEHRRRGRAPPDSKSFEAVSEALKVAFASRHNGAVGESRRRFLSGLGSYAAELVDIAKALGRSATLPVDKPQVLESISELEAISRNLDPEESLQVWDTIAHARWKLQGPAEAAAAAGNVLNAFRQLGGPSRTGLYSAYQKEQEALAYSRALLILGIATGEEAL